MGGSVVQLRRLQPRTRRRILSLSSLGTLRRLVALQRVGSRRHLLYATHSIPVVFS